MKTLWNVPALALGLSLALLGPGCKKKPDGKPATGGTTSGGAGGETVKATPLQPFGVLDPTPRLSSEAGKSLEAAWKAYKAKSWSDAQQHFTAVVTAAPDYLPARWALVRTLAQGGQFGELPAAFEALIARDFLNYWKKLDDGKEFTALRAAPEWSKIGALKARYSDAFQKGFVTGIYVVLASKAQKDLAWNKDVAELHQNQEAYHYDPESKRFTRVTDTGGHVQAILPSKDGKAVAFLVADKLVRISEGREAYVEPKIGVVDLDDLSTIGPAPLKASTELVVLMQAKDLSWHFGFRTEGKDKYYAFDTAKTGLTELDIDAEAVFVGKTASSPKELLYTAPVQEGTVEIKSDKQFLVQGSPQVIVAARPIAAASFAWSPKKSRVAYAGVLDACALAEAKEAAKDPKKKAKVDPDKGKNELFVFDKQKGAAQRLAQGVSSYRVIWFDDDKVVFDEGIGASAKVIVYSINDHAPTPLPTRFGAGLFGLPIASCKQAELAPTTPPPDAEGENVPADEGD